LTAGYGVRLRDRPSHDVRDADLLHRLARRIDLAQLRLNGQELRIEGRKAADRRVRLALDVEDGVLPGVIEKTLLAGPDLGLELGDAALEPLGLVRALVDPPVHVRLREVLGDRVGDLRGELRVVVLEADCDELRRGHLLHGQTAQDVGDVGRQPLDGRLVHRLVRIRD
jgi:hypothetical protein